MECEIVDLSKHSEVLACNAKEMKEVLKAVSKMAKWKSAKSLDASNDLAWIRFEPAMGGKAYSITATDGRELVRVTAEGSAVIAALCELLKDERIVEHLHASELSFLVRADFAYVATLKADGVIGERAYARTDVVLDHKVPRERPESFGMFGGTTIAKIDALCAVLLGLDRDAEYSSMRRMCKAIGSDIYAVIDEDFYSFATVIVKSYPSHLT